MFGEFMAARVRQPALELDTDECEMIAKSLANVGKHYDVPVSPLTQAWLGLAYTVGMIYSAKIISIRMTHKTVVAA